jgi:hypothetical protein
VAGLLQSGTDESSTALQDTVATSLQQTPPTTPVPSPPQTPPPANPVITLAGGGILFAPLPFNTPPVTIITPTSGDFLNSVEDTDTGSSLFGGISSNPEAGSSGSGNGSSRSPSAGNSQGGNTQLASAGNPGQGRGTDGGALNGSGNDSGDRAMTVMADQPPIGPVNHSQPLPQKVTAPLVPGLVDQVQHGNSAPKGTPGVTTNFSSSGNSNGW